MLPRNIKQEVKKNNRKHWLLASVPLALAGCGMALFVAIDKQPAKAPENTFENKTEKVVKQNENSTSNINDNNNDNDVCVSNSNNNSDYSGDIQGDETVTETPEWDVAEDYTTLRVYASQMGWYDTNGNKITRSGFYVVTPQQQSKYIQANVIEYDARTNDTYYLTVSVDPSLHPNSTDDQLWSLVNEKAEKFCNYMREICPSAHTQNGLQSNFDYWMEYEDGRYYK